MGKEREEGELARERRTRRIDSELTLSKVETLDVVEDAEGLRYRALREGVESWKRRSTRGRERSAKEKEGGGSLELNTKDETQDLVPFRFVFSFVEIVVNVRAHSSGRRGRREKF